MKLKNVAGRALIKMLYFLSWFEKTAYSAGILKADNNRLPDFLCIGAQKAGTTWLYENLRCHPDIFIPEERALHYFDQRFYRSLSYYSRYFEGWEDKIKGEAMPGYGLLSLDRIQFIRKIIPELKLILLLRNPIERAWSHAMMRFTKFQDRPFASITNSEFISHFQSKLSLQKGDYLNILSNWEKVFPEKSIGVYFFDDVIERPEELLNKIFEFIEVSTITDFKSFKAHAKINANQKTEIPEECLSHLKKLYKEDIFCLQKRFGGPVDHWIKKYYG